VATPRPITFLSDYGYEDEFAGVCRAVISQIAPGASLIDLTHGIARQDIRQGAVALANALPSCPPGVHLAVVDPGVGSERRAVAVAAPEERILVGPHLSLGAHLDETGQSIDAGSLVELDLPTPRITDGEVVAHAIHLDGYGNVTLDLDASMLADGPLRPGDALEVRAPDGRWEAVWVGTFVDVGPADVLLFEDSSGALALAVSGGNAAELMDLRTDSEVTLRPLK
jgi:S-adenosylmethionine hydrolase